jgi:hypothetical protein
LLDALERIHDYARTCDVEIESLHEIKERAMGAVVAFGEQQEAADPESFRGWELIGDLVRGPERPSGTRPVISAHVSREVGHLICAAPDLLAACKAAKDAIEFGGSSQTGEALRLIRAALAKAGVA